MLFNIIACVLAVLVPAVVGLALLIYVQNARSRVEAKLFANFSAMQGTLATYSTQLSELAARLTTCESGLKQTSAAHVEAELADLAADVAKLASASRKQFGRIFAELHHDGTLQRNVDRQQDVETPEQVRNRLRAQHGLPTLAAKRSNGAAEGE